jgi:hypothetical protein
MARCSFFLGGAEFPNPGAHLPDRNRIVETSFISDHLNRSTNLLIANAGNRLRVGIHIS